MTIPIGSPHPQATNLTDLTYKPRPFTLGGPFEPIGPEVNAETARLASKLLDYVSRVKYPSTELQRAADSAAALLADYFDKARLPSLVVKCADASS